MPRKSAAVPAAAKGSARPKAAPAKAAKPAAKPAAKAAAKPAATSTVKAPAVKAAPAKAAKSTKPAVKAAAKAAAKSLATPVAKRAARKVPAVAATVRETDMGRPVLVRDSFTMPEQEYAVLAEVKGACLRAGIDVKKSELLRIGVALLGQVDMATLKSVLAALPQLKTGRPPAAP